MRNFLNRGFYTAFFLSVANSTYSASIAPSEISASAVVNQTITVQREITLDDPLVFSNAGLNTSELVNLSLIGSSQNLGVISNYSCVSPEGCEQVAFGQSRIFEMEITSDSLGAFDLSSTLLPFNLAIAEDALTVRTCVRDVESRASRSKISVVWTDTDAHSYNVYRASDVNGPYDLIANTSSGYSTYGDRDVISGNTYYYQINELDANGLEICESNIASTYLKSRSGPSNLPPEIVSIPVLTAEESVLYNYQVVATDPENGPVSYQITQSPAGMSISPEGLIEWVPAVGQLGLHAVYVLAIDDGGLTDSQVFVVDVSEKNEPPLIVSEPIEETNELSQYLYQVVAEDPNEDDVLSYQLDFSPNDMAIDNSGLISWNPDASWTQSVPTFNQQCYVVPTGSAKVYEEGDDDNSLAYIAPLFQQVKQALEDASDYTGERTVQWDQRNRCLGCHVQTQTLLGLQASLEKADVDLDSAEFLLNEILTSQQSDGSIRQSHANFSKTQTAFALWSLSYVPDFERTLFERARALNFMMARQQTASGQVYWQQDHNTGWMREFNSISSVVALSAARYIQDVRKIELPATELLDVEAALLTQLPEMNQFFLSRAYSNDNESLWLAFRLIAMAELLPLLEDDLTKTETQNAIDWLDEELRSRQLANGGWSRYGSSSAADPLTSAWVGLALNYLNPPLSDIAVTNNIQYLLDSQTPSGTWVTTSGLFSTHLATTSLVMAYLPVALEHLGNPDVYAGRIYLDEGTNGLHRLTANVSNRGLADITTPVSVNFFNGDGENELLGSIDLSGLNSGEQSSAEIFVADADLTDHVYVSLSSASDADECEITNNKSHAALVRVNVSDSKGLSDKQIYTLNVLDVNEAPVIVSEAPTEHQAGQGLVYQVEVEDQDQGDGHKFTLLEAPDNVYIDLNTGKLTAAPGALAPGNYTVVVQVTDLRGQSTTQTITFTVYANEPPQIISVAVAEGMEYSGYRYDVDAVDPNGDALEYALELFPQSSWIDKDTGVVNWVGNSSFVEPDSSSNEFCISNQKLEIGEFEPVLKWQNSQGYVLSLPVVAPLIDSNLDGAFDTKDEPVVLVNQYGGFVDSASGRLVALNGKTGEQLWAQTTAEIRASSSIAVANILGDAAPEVLYYDRNGYVTATDNNGNILWKNTDVYVNDRYNYGAISVADLNGDGSPEVIAKHWVVDANGNLLWSSDRSIGHRSSAIAVDTDGDGTQEVLMGGYLYSHDGVLLTEFGFGTSYNAVANMDGDDDPELIAVHSYSVSVFDMDGTVVWGPTAIPGGGGGSPTVSDLDGDGLAEVGVSGRSVYAVFDDDGSVLWQRTVQDYSSRTTGSTVFDFDADGDAEIVYADERYLRIFDGRTGDVEFSIPNYSATAAEYPVVADIDADGHAEILITSDGGSTRGIRALEDLNDSWAPTRKIWNQYNYQVNNINDDLTVPTIPVKSWLTHNTFRLNTFPDRPALGLADVTVHNIRFNEITQTLSAEVTNRGLAPVDEPIAITFTHEHNWTGDTELSQLVLASLDIGESQIVGFSVSDMTVLEQSIKVEVTPSSDTAECLTDNNVARAAMMQASVYDQAGESDIQTFTVSITNENDLPTISSSASSTFIESTEFSFQVEISDIDIGDDHRFELLDAPADIEIDEFSGKISSQGLAAGAYPFTIRAYDLAGEIAEQVHMLTIVLPDNYAPVINSSAPTAVVLGETYEYAVTATDADGDDIQFFMTRTQPGISIDPDSGLMLWTPTEDFVGLYSVEVGVTDEHGAISTQYFLIDVVEPDLTNIAPVITSIPSGLVVAGQQFSYQVVATDADSDPLTYRIISDISAIEIDSQGLLTWLPEVELIGQAIIVEVIVDDGRGGVASQKMTLPVNDSSNTPPSIDSMPALSVVEGELYVYDIIASDPDGDNFTIELLDKPNGMNLVGNSVSWTPSPQQANIVHNVVVKVTDDRGAASTQTFGVGVQPYVAPNDAPIILSNPASFVVLGEIFDYTLIASDADGDLLTFVNQTPLNGVTFSDEGVMQWTPSADQLGEHTFVLEVSDGRASATQTFTVTVVNDSSESNEAPTIQSLPTSPAFVGDVYQYQVVAMDVDGDALTYQITPDLSGLTISTEGLVQWIPAVDQIASHTLVVSVSDAFSTTTQTFTLDVVEAPVPDQNGDSNNAPEITSVPRTEAAVGIAYEYQLIATDADGDVLVYASTVLPDNAEISDTGLLTWTPTSDQMGIHDVVLTVDDGQIRALQSYTIAVFENSLPIDVFVNVEPQNPGFGELVEVQVLASGGADTLNKTLSVNNVEHTLDPFGRASILANTYGVNNIVVSVTDGTDTVTRNSWFSVFDPLDTEAPELTLHTPVDDQVITAPTDVIATINDANLREWQLILKEKGSKPTEYQVIAMGDSNVNNAAIATFDPTLILNGQYALILTAEDNNGLSEQTSVTISVEGEMKLGHFAMTFEDLTVDLAGIPIQVTRTYDTRQRHKDLDFGHGWSIDYQNVRVQESRTTGFSWSLNYYRTGFFGEYCVEPNGDPIVTVRLPDGNVEKFKAKAIPECTSIIPTVDVQIGFEPIGDTQSELEQNDYGLLRIVNGNIVDLSEPSQPVDADAYTLTMQDGMKYRLDQNFGIRQVIEPAGQYITYSDDGIVHSLGYEIDFERDAYDRITALILPDGRRVEYGYDISGDLMSVTDMSGNMTQMSYVFGAPHYLDEVIDPRGVRATKIIYDEDGRLTSIVDADGNEVAYEHDLVGQTETVYDRNGNPTTYVYDDNGYVLIETNAEGESTIRTYTEYGDVLTETNHLGETTTWTYSDKGFQLSETNDLGETTSWTYTNNGEMLTETNNRNEVVLTNTYDPRSLRLTSSTDAMDNVTQFHWDVGIGAPCGSGSSQGYTDALGNRFQTQPICFGPLSGLTRSETDQLGNVTQYDYDNEGRKITQTQWRTDEFGSSIALVTSYEYDEQDRIVRVTHPDNSVTQTEYNSIGKVASEVDQLGRRTEFVYNDRGEEIEMHFEDGTFTAKSYDANGNVVSETDRAGRTTVMIYDRVNRLVETIYPDETPGDDSDNPRVRSEYNAAGRLVANIDANGNRTEYEYDSAGRRTLIRDALLNETQFEYDDLGRKVSMIDANLNRTEYLYDELDRVTETRFADGSSIQVAYDALGRKVSETDELSRITQYEYDDKGQLTKVIDANLNETIYSYDEQGNKLTQTDANGFTTRWTYDDSGRVTSRTLPEGQQEYFAYDVIGNLISHTDFNGNTTRYEYDAETGYQTLIDYPFDTDVSKTYTVGGQLSSVTDARGTTVYSYDAQYRLNRVEYPNGGYVEYAYDLNGNRTLVRSAHGDVDYTFDALNRLESVTDQTGSTEYNYTNVGSRDSVLFPNGIETTYVYDSRNRLVRLETKDSADTTLLGLSYTLNLNGTRAQIDEDDGITTIYSYDNLDRLTQEQVVGLANGNKTTTWSYDNTANRQTQTVSDINGIETTTYSYDENDRLLSESNSLGTTSYVYDENGNTTNVIAPTVTTTYVWNDDNRLSQMSNSNGDVASYSYDANGIRQSKTENGLVRNFLIDENTSYADVIAEEDGFGNLIVAYTHSDEILSQTRSGVANFFHADALGSIRLLTSALGVQTDNYTFSAFGGLSNQSGITENSYLYTGEQYDDGLGLYYLRDRYNNTETGRFVSRDKWLGKECSPITLNKYIYGNSDPVRFVDPSGYMGLADVGAALNIRGIMGASSQASFRVTVKRIGKDLACVAIEETVTNLVMQQLTGGIYILADAGAGYVGRTNDFDRRMQEHLRSSKRKVEGVLALFHMEMDRNDQRLVEQFFMDTFRAANQPLTNTNNSIAQNPSSQNSRNLRRMMDRLDFCD